MKDRKIFLTLALILIIGVLVTAGTSYLLKGSLKMQSETGDAVERGMPPEGPGQERNPAGETAASAPSDSTDTKASNTGSGRSANGQEAGSGIGIGRSAEDRTGGEASGPVPETRVAGNTEELEEGVEAAWDDGRSEPPAAPISPLETTAAVSGEESLMVVGDASTEYSYYQSRLMELDAQIQKNREQQAASNSGYFTKNAVSSELKLWDTELNAIYNEIIKNLSEAEANELVEKEREWMKERDRLAAEAAKASAGGSLESVEYTLSLTESTRARAYELVNTYGHALAQ